MPKKPKITVQKLRGKKQWVTVKNLPTFTEPHEAIIYIVDNKIPGTLRVKQGEQMMTLKPQQDRDKILKQYKAKKKGKK